MEPHHLEQARLLLLESAASPLAADSGGEESRSVGGKLMEESKSVGEKLMEKRSLVFELNKLPSSVERMGRGPFMSMCIESDPFMVGGHNFRIQLYPHGPEKDNCVVVSLSIKNESEKAVQLVPDIQRLNHSHYHSGSKECVKMDLRYNSFDDGEREYRRVVTLEPGGQHGKLLYFFTWFPTEEGPFVFRATIGAFVDDDDDDDDDKLCLSPPLDRCILFQVGDWRYFAEKAVIASRCPALLLDCSQSDHIVVLPDIERDVFEAVLWFINNYRIHKLDKKAITNSRGDELDKKAITNSGGDSFALKMLAAANKFHLKDLRQQCESYICYGNSELVDCYYIIETDTKRAWRWLSHKMKEKLPQKMKEA